MKRGRALYCDAAVFSRNVPAVSVRAASYYKSCSAINAPPWRWQNSRLRLANFKTKMITLEQQRMQSRNVRLKIVLGGGKSGCSGSLGRPSGGGSSGGGGSPLALLGSLLKAILGL